MRKNYLSVLSGLGIALLLPFTALSQTDYPNLAQIGQRLQSVARDNAATLTSLTKTEGGKDIWVLKIGRGDMDNKPGVAVVGGVEGYHLLSVELALQFAEKLVAERSEALENTTFYVFPNMSPDAYEQYFSGLKFERRGNAAKVDHDRDGSMGEDTYEDLNKDGLITMMRVESPMGDHIPSSTDERVMVKANVSKGERGRYLMYTEGIDNDKDGNFNEDPAEGIAFNKNLTYKFPAFEPLAGDYPVSQKESRAMVDYLFDRWNIFAFITFGPANNLSSPLKYHAGDAKKRVVTSILEKDMAINAMISELYNETITAKAHQQKDQGTDGDFFQWAYFHFARLSFSTPGWWVPEMKNEEGKVIEDASENFLAYAQQEAMESVFVPWTKVDHPDFKGQNVEVGGIKPFLMNNPSYNKVGQLADEHTDFILKLAEMQPKLEFHNMISEKLGNGLTRITADLFNNSPLPTHSEMGAQSRWLRKIRVDINSEKKDIIAGDKIMLIDKMGPFEKQTISWIVKGSGNVEVKAGAAHVGFANLNVRL
ncbi:M14 family metallopeptidase [Anditalea andensis]|uniref:Peptidase n=1 Tax=Anditalea andensis TaxID=1048983 RepID=A0A074KZU7_9BACT|nr:M14 family metallopeptidase [Anditalea andensis]KEO73103.1 peptidase [Anditalea andensis]